MFDIYIAVPAFGTGTFTNHYAVYQAHPNARNWFAGNVGIGASRTSPSSALDVNGTVTATAVQISGNTLNSTSVVNILNSTNLYLWSNFR